VETQRLAKQQVAHLVVGLRVFYVGIFQEIAVEEAAVDRNV
jgi:hypothetical protein